jgi:hypothetical protein
MDKKTIVVAGGVLGVVAIAYLLSQNSGAKTGGVISAGMWGFPTSGYTAPADPAPPVNIDFPGVEIPPMQPPAINYPEVPSVRYDYYSYGSGGGSTKKQTVDSSSQSSTFGGSSGFGGGGVGGRSGDAPTTATFGGSSGFGGGGVGGRSGDAPTTAKKTSTGPSMGGFGVSHSAPSSGGTTSAAAPSVASAVGSAIGSVASSIGSALSSIGKAFGW